MLYKPAVGGAKREGEGKEGGGEGGGEGVRSEQRREWWAVREGSEGGGGSGGPDLLYPALKQRHYSFRQQSALYGCHIADWCTTQRLLATRSCRDGRLHLSMVSVGTHGHL